MTITKLNTKTVAVAVAFGLALALVFGFSVQSAGAQVSNIQLVDLLIQLGVISPDKAAAARAAVAGPSVASMTFTRDLTVGSTGADVTALQNKLGVSPATGYFGSITKAAVMQYQAANGIAPATGYFGPLTRAKMNAGAMVVTTPTAPTAPTGPTTPTVTVTGSGEGFLDDVEKISSINTEEVGEGAKDIKVLGVEAIAEDADQKVDRVIVEIEELVNSGSDDLDDYVTSVSLWLDSTLLGRMDVDDASYDRTDDEYTFRFTGLNGVIKEGDLAKLYVAVSAVGNLDSTDLSSWEVRLPTNSIRAVSPNGTDDFYDSAVITDSFTVEAFASANSVELKVSLDNSNPDSTVVNVDTTGDTDGVTLLVFKIKAEGSDLTINDLPVLLTVTGATSTRAVANSLTLKVGGNEFSENVSGTATTETVTFDDIDFTISEGQTVTFTVLVDINDLEGGTYPFDEGDTLKAELTSTTVDAIDAQDESNEDITNADATGTALGDEMSFYNVGVYVTFVSATQSVVDGGSSAFDGTGTFTIKFRVEAFDGTVYVSDSAVATTAATIPDATVTSAGVRYLVDGAGTATTADLSTIVTFSTAGGATDVGITNGVQLEDGEKSEFTLTATRTNNNVGDAGLYRVLLKAITWAITDATTQTVYDFDLEDYKTDAVSIN